MAIAPFIRQFAHVDSEWFFKTQYMQVIRWLNGFLESERFQEVMQKNPETY
jgi:glutathione S-transferase